MNTPGDREDPLFNVRWQGRLRASATGGHVLPPDFVIEQGASVHLVDLRSPAELVGPLGHVPGSSFVQFDDIERIAHGAPKDLPIILISRDGTSALEAAVRLERLGMTRVAALEGGLVAWKLMGYATSRDPKSLARAPRWTEHPTADEAPERTLPDGRQVLSLRQIRTHVGDPLTVRWIRMAALMLHGKTSCVDGRDERGVVGTPGGDGGEFLLAIAAAERVLGHAIERDALPDLLTAWADTFGRFYVHTDAGALDKLMQSMRSDARLAPTVEAIATVEQRRDFMLKPPSELRDAMLEHIRDPANLGCGHIRLSLQNSEMYGVRRELVSDFIEAFYRLWWQGNAELTMTVLGGGHEEKAVVNVRLRDEVWPFSEVPLVSPRYDHSQMFVNHPDVAKFMRRHYAQFLIRHDALRGIDVGCVDALVRTLDELGTQQLLTTLGFLAKGLPIYEVVFAPDRTFEVREA